MATAKKVGAVEGVYPSTATLYEVDPPIIGSSHVVVFHAPPVTAGQSGQMVVVRATPNGASFTRSIDPVGGTHHTLNPDEGHELSLELAGRLLGVGAYEIVAGDPPVDPAVTLAEAEATS